MDQWIRCLAGAARDIWDQKHTIKENEVRYELSFDGHMKELTSMILRNDGLCNKKKYLKSTPKPEKMTEKQWINRIKNINSYLTLMQGNGHAFPEEDLISEVISKNIPSTWVNDFKIFKIHLKICVRDVMENLTIIEEQVKTQDNTHLSKKKLNNPYRQHNGTHEWDECQQNPKKKQWKRKDK